MKFPDYVAEYSLPILAATTMLLRNF